jgi:hypothetical protein
MVDLLVALVEFFIQILVLVIELIGGLIGLVFGWLDRTGSPAETTSSGDPRPLPAQSPVNNWLGQSDGDDGRTCNG